MKKPRKKKWKSKILISVSILFTKRRIINLIKVCHFRILEVNGKNGLNKQRVCVQKKML